MDLLRVIGRCVLTLLAVALVWIIPATIALGIAWDNPSTRPQVHAKDIRDDQRVQTALDVVAARRHESPGNSGSKR